MELSNNKFLLACSNGEKIRRKSMGARDRIRFMVKEQIKQLEQKKVEALKNPQTNAEYQARDLI